MKYERITNTIVYSLEAGRPINAWQDVFSHNTPTFIWILCMIFVTMMFNIIVIPTLGWKTPTDVSPQFYSEIFQFSPVWVVRSGLIPWWKWIRFLDSKEKLVHWYGLTKNWGDALKYFIYTPYINYMVSRSVFRPASDPTNINKRALPDPYFSINDKPDSDTYIKGRGKGE